MDGEIVKIEMDESARLTLRNQLVAGMLEAGIEPPDFKTLDLGFELAESWPYEGEILLSQIVVLANRLKLRIVIGALELEPMT